MANTINITEERIQTIDQAAVNQKTSASTAEICFGALMAVAAIAGMWGVASLIISYFIG